MQFDYPDSLILEQDQHVENTSIHWIVQDFQLLVYTKQNEPKIEESVILFWSIAIHGPPTVYQELLI